MSDEGKVGNMFRNNLFIKICLSFWLTTLFMIGAVVTVDWLTETGPFHSARHPIHGGPLAVHGQAFAWILEHEGASSLRDFADRLRDATGIRAHFFDEKGGDLTGQPGAANAAACAAVAMTTGGADFASSRERGPGGVENRRVGRQVLCRCRRDAPPFAAPLPMPSRDGS